MKIINTEKVVIKSWCNNPEEGAIEQAKNLANLPFIFRQVCLMPDTHQGYGMPIGGVIATNGVVVPNAVGVDIGCGMCAVKTNLNINNITKAQLKSVMKVIREDVPVGFNHHKEKQEWNGFEHAPDIPIVKSLIESARYQLGTLGSGNHFIEIQQDESGNIWVMIHSGSRNFGYNIAKDYNKKAQELCEIWHSNIPTPKGEDGLAFLPLQSNEGKEYMEAMNYALKFAKANRFRMIAACKNAFKLVFDDVEFGDIINIHHNYAVIEHHFGKNVVIHRKGATSAKEGELGIIPGSQGTSSYIVEGLGNPNSFNSCSHGAGRVMGRKKAKENLNLDHEIKILDDLGVIHGIRSVEDLDEAPSAYKDINIVMEEQQDLVKIVTKLTPVAVIKG